MKSATHHVKKVNHFCNSQRETSLKIKQWNHAVVSFPIPPSERPYTLMCRRVHQRRQSTWLVCASLPYVTTWNNEFIATITYNLNLAGGHPGMPTTKQLIRRTTIDKLIKLGELVYIIKHVTQISIPCISLELERVLAMQFYMYFK